MSDDECQTNKTHTRVTLTRIKMINLFDKTYTNLY